MDSRGDKRKEAAKLVASSKHSIAAIAQIIGCSVRTIHSWKADAEFNDLVAQIREGQRKRALEGGICQLPWTLRHAKDRHARIRGIIEARAKDPEHRKAPGGKTGMLTITYKMRALGDKQGHEMVPEYAFDAALNEAMSAIEIQVQTHLGNWKQKVEHGADSELSWIMQELNDGRRRVAEDRERIAAAEEARTITISGDTA